MSRKKVFQIDGGWVWSIALLSVRMSVLFYVSILDLFGRIPGRFRFLLLVTLTFLIINIDPLLRAQLPETLMEMLQSLMSEFVLGFVLAIGLHTAFSTFQVAGRLIDFQSGFGAAGLLNPATNTSEPLIGTVLLFFAMFIFFAIDGHHMLIRGVIFSVEKIPLGREIGDLDFELIISQFSIAFLLGMTIAAPVIVTLFIVDSGFAVMGKTMPQMNVYFLILPLKVALGIGLTAISLKYLQPVYEEVFVGVFRYWHNLILAG